MRCDNCGYIEKFDPTLYVSNDNNESDVKRIFKITKNQILKY